MKCLIFTLLILSAGFWFEPEIRAQSNTNVVVSFATTNATPLNLGFAGCGDGTLTVARRTAPGEFQVVQTMHTPRGARTSRSELLILRVEKPGRFHLPDVVF
jgi:hypothetical protein